MHGNPLAITIGDWCAECFMLAMMPAADGIVEAKNWAKRTGQGCHCRLVQQCRCVMGATLRR